MPFLVPVFANNMARYFDSESPAYEGVKGDISGVASPGTAKGWSESLKLASTAIFPPSVSIPAAEAACFGVLAGWSTSNDSNGNILKSGIDAFYVAYAPGCLPAFVAVPPTQCPIENTYPSGLGGISHTQWAMNCGNVISTWLQQGTWTQTSNGATGPWV